MEALHERGKFVALLFYSTYFISQECISVCNDKKLKDSVNRLGTCFNKSLAEAIREQDFPIFFFFTLTSYCTRICPQAFHLKDAYILKWLCYFPRRWKGVKVFSSKICLSPLPPRLEITYILLTKTMTYGPS